MTSPVTDSEGRCKSCGAVILWAQHVRTGKPMPFDAEQRVGGTWVIDERGGVLMAHYAPERGAFEHGYVPHFATCPHADQHRQPRA